MSVTTVDKEYKRLRSYLNPFFKGPTVDAVLTALATGNSSYLVNSVAAVNDNLYIVTASGVYLDQRLADYGIVRPANANIADDVFREIGIAVKNRKQVRDLLNNILKFIFGDSYVRATNKSTALEPYALTDGDTLIIDFDGARLTTVTFYTGQFENIAAATAQEVASAISASINTFGFPGAALVRNDGGGNYVELISDTIGPISSITVTGGSAQNVLLFPSIVPAGGTLTTQWAYSLRTDGIVRFTWSGGVNPQLGKVLPGDYVNIFGGGFAGTLHLEGSFTIIESVGGIANSSYFDIFNPLLSTTGVVTQGTNNALLFFNPIRKTLTSNSSYAAIYQTESNVLQIFIPVTTNVTGRGRRGSAHLHEPQNFVYTFHAQPNNGDLFSIATGHTLIANTDFTIGVDIPTTAANLATAVSAIVGLAAVTGNTNGALGYYTVTVFQDIPSLTLAGTYTGAANIVSSGVQGDPQSSEPNQPGPYMYDLSQSFTVSDINTTLTQDLNGNVPRIFNVANASSFPNNQGYLIFGYGTSHQEGPVPYIATPSNSTILLSPIYTIRQDHPSGTTVSLVSANSPVMLAIDGSDYEFFITDVVNGRIYAQSLIKAVAATGINVVFTVLYPNSIGLGKWGTQYDEISAIWGP